MFDGSERLGRRALCKTTGLALGGGAVLSAGTGSATATKTLHVDPSDSGSYDRISAAVDDAEPGDTVRVAPATYEEQVFVWTDDLTIVGSPGDPAEPGPAADRPVIDGGGRDEAAGFRLTDSTGTTVAGFEVRNFGTNSWGTGVKGGGADVEIRDNYLHDLTNGVGRAGWGQVDPANFTVTRNVTEATDQRGIRLDNVSDSVVEGNVVRGPGRHGIFVHNNVSQGESVDNSDVRVAGNTVTGEFANAIRVLSINRNDDRSTTASLDDLRIEDNDLSAGGSFVGITLLVNASEGAPTDLTGVAVTGNDVRDHDCGLFVGQGADGSEVEVHRNNIAGNETGLLNGNDGVVDAERNYWGAPDGPTRPGPGESDRTLGSGDRVRGPVEVTPWSPQPF